MLSIDDMPNWVPGVCVLQEVALNHVGLAGIGGNGFGTTKAMSSHNLIWVVNRMHVEVEHYPTWYGREKHGFTSHHHHLSRSSTINKIFN
jgi:hypothetical protein